MIHPYIQNPKAEIKIHSYEKNEPPTRPRLATAIYVLRWNVLCDFDFFCFHLHIDLPDHEEQKVFAYHGEKS